MQLALLFFIIILPAIRNHQADRRITERIEKLGNELGIHLLDHIILGNKRYFSFKERGLLGEVR